MRSQHNTTPEITERYFVLFNIAIKFPSQVSRFYTKHYMLEIMSSLPKILRSGVLYQHYTSYYNTPLFVNLFYSYCMYDWQILPQHTKWGYWMLLKAGAGNWGREMREFKVAEENPDDAAEEDNIGIGWLSIFHGQFGNPGKGTPSAFMTVALSCLIREKNIKHTVNPTAKL